MENQVEIWKAHPEYAGIEVSTFGRVRTLDRVVPCIGNGTRSLKGKVLKQNKNNCRYLLVNIPINGKRAAKLVHRLVAQTFISNPDNLPMVNHKDCNIKNNNVENLEFCSASYNSKYREEFGKALSKPVYAIDLSTLRVSHFKSQSEASRVLGANVGNINNVIKGRYKSTGGYWFTNDDENAADTIKRKLQEIKKNKIDTLHVS